MKGRTFALLVERKAISQQTVQGTAPVLVNPPAQPQGERGDQGVEAVECKIESRNPKPHAEKRRIRGDQWKRSARGQREDKVRGVWGQREDRVRGGKASSKMGRDTGTMERSYSLQLEFGDEFY
ncbi:unnamed protein product [Microthlaspi erraticum]|uniref:Uncharacterized protein n=1 Tax=Microthlaspi erraticum TaxID=1685480 RepID=A0A6D2L521_9BRAS|nr:unnamed protein product [Microthlaspi erraticum]